MFSRSIRGRKKHPDKCSGRRPGTHSSFRGIGPLTALAMEVRYGDVPTFEAEYHTASNLWQGIVFPLERGHTAALKAATGRDADTKVPFQTSWRTRGP